MIGDDYNKPSTEAVIVAADTVGGDDFMRGYGENDTIKGGFGNDIIHGDDGDDRLYG